MRHSFFFILIVFPFNPVSTYPALGRSARQCAPASLVELLTRTGVLSAGESRNINAALSGQPYGQLLPLLRDKGLISADPIR
ncbi:MAG TPA: hypothetical protein VKB77_06335 [Terriglobales bacterium]|nr:hypothetical protein [Terriglobales bacterium]